jgi:hypothetical protein
MSNTATAEKSRKSPDDVLLLPPGVSMDVSLHAGSIQELGTPHTLPLQEEQPQMQLHRLYNAAECVGSMRSCPVIAIKHACMHLPAAAVSPTSPSRAAASLPPLPLMLGAERAAGAGPDPDCLDNIPPIVCAAAGGRAADQRAV